MAVETLTKPEKRTAARTATALSADGTRIAFQQEGSGPVLILVDGALCSRTLGPSAAMAKELARHFTVVSYDRRGRGESGNALPHAVEREVEDIAALLDAVGGEAFVWGISSGAMLALAAAARLPRIKKLALYEAPLIVDGSKAPTAAGWEKIRQALDQDRRSDALKQFLRLVGVPGLMLALMPFIAPWAKMKAAAPTLMNDFAVVGEYQQGRPLPAGAWADVTLPVLVMSGSKSAAWMQSASRALAAALPNACYAVVEGDDHMVKARLHAPMLRTFFGG